MSWGISIPETTQAEVAEHLRKAVDDYKAGLTDSLSTEAEGQIEAAAKAFADVVATGALGGGPVTGSLSGHANPGHKPKPGWAGDAISVSVRSTEVAADA